MMPVSLNSVKDCECIFSCEDTVILSGKKPWIFRKDGSFIANLKTIRNAYNMVFLPDNMVLMDGCGDGCYHYVSLANGEVVWSCAKKGRRDLLLDMFAVSPDGKVIYHVYYNNGMLQADLIDPLTAKYDTYTIPTHRGATHGCFCDNNGDLILMQSRLINENNGESSYFLNEVVEWSPTSSRPMWVKQWRRLPRIDPIPCAFDRSYVLYDNLTAMSFDTGKVVNLLENSPAINRAPGGITIQAYDQERNLLTVLFTSSRSTVIIDCQKRAIVAHYAPVSPGLSGGCLIGDEFWIGTSDGVIKRPFPNMDNFPRRL